MGKSPAAKRLVIWVDPQWYDHAKIRELDERGHSIVNLNHILSDASYAAVPDLILSKAGHAWSDDLWPFLDVAIKRARERKVEVVKDGP